AAKPPAARSLRQLPADELCVTHGTIESLPGGKIAITHPEVRAVAAGRGDPAATMRFTYLGRSVKSAPLASGEVRRQIGLKLRAQDGCTVTYVMWRIDPSPELVVSVKRNPGQSTAKECGVHGYRTVATLRSAPEPRPGEPHLLAAAMNDDELAV